MIYLLSKLVSLLCIILAVGWTVVQGEPNNWAIYLLLFAVLLKMSPNED